MNKKKMIFDSVFNIIATAIPIIVLQLIVLPVVGIKLGQNQYGLVITLISLTTVFSVPFGNVLNNVRLLTEENYKKNEIIGDFNFLLVCSVLANSFLVVLIIFFTSRNLNNFDLILITIISGLNIIREYFLVTFRLTLNYRKVLENNIIQAVGYLIGLILFYIFLYWEFIYISGLVISIFFLIKNTDLHKEGFKKTKLFTNTLYQSIILFISTFMKTFLTYADRILLFPLLGAVGVSIYYSSSIVGKILGMAIMPISSVMLSYLRGSKEVSKSKFLKLIFTLIIICVIGFFVINLLSEPLLKILYPKWYEESIKLIPVNTANALIIVIISIIHPLILKFRNIKWQMVINVINLLSYILLLYFFFKWWGLLGFCIGLLISNLLKLFIMISVYLFGK